MMYHLGEVTEWHKKLPHGTKQALICSALLSNVCYTLYLVDESLWSVDVLNWTMVKHKPAFIKQKILWMSMF